MELWNCWCCCFTFYSVGLLSLQIRVRLIDGTLMLNKTWLQIRIMANAIKFNIVMLRYHNRDSVVVVFIICFIFVIFAFCLYVFVKDWQYILLFCFLSLKFCNTFLFAYCFFFLFFSEIGSLKFSKFSKSSLKFYYLLSFLLHLAILSVCLIFVFQACCLFFACVFLPNLCLSASSVPVTFHQDELYSVHRIWLYSGLPSL